MINSGVGARKTQWDKMKLESLVVLKTNIKDKVCQTDR